MTRILQPFTLAVSYTHLQHDVRVAAVSSDDESIFVTELVPITFPEEKLEQPPPPEDVYKRQLKHQWIHFHPGSTPGLGTTKS